MKKAILAISLTTVGIVGCDSAEDAIQANANAIRLQPLGSCNEVAARVKAKAIREMNTALDNQLKQALSGSSTTCWMNEGSVAIPNMIPTSVIAPTSSGTSGGAKEYSTTNNQVAGVDEADFLKNDGQYIYILGTKTLRIVKAWPATESQTIATVPVEGTPKKLFVHNDKALVYSSLPVGVPANYLGDAQLASGPWSGSKECTYGYDCDFTGDGKPTKITLFDIKDRTHPVLIREIVTSSSYVNSRRIDSAVFTVLASARALFANLPTWPSGIQSCGVVIEPAKVRTAFAKLRIENTRIIELTPISAYMPVITSTDARGQRSENMLADCGDFYAEGGGGGGAFTTVMTLDMDREKSPSFATIWSGAGAVYASPSALYFSVPQQQVVGQFWYPGHEETKQLSTVHKFVLDKVNASVNYAGSGLVKGRVLNQFAMDEYEGHLRIATTTGHVPNSGVHSTMTVLGQDGTSLLVTGVLDNLAPGEDIRSVRFDGKRGYVVTFKKTDPLFVFDLHDPTAPVVEAELKIPGFSTYMHRMDENHLLTIGYDAADQGNFAYFTGVLIQIFDVTDAKNPFLKWKHVIGTRGSSSEALTNHLAFNYFAPKDLLLLPMTICEGGTTGGSFGSTMTFSGLMVFGATTQMGLAENGRVTHPAGAGVTCNNWWTQASSQVERSIIMDDFVFSISRSVIKVNNLANLASDVASVSLVDP